MSQFLDKIKNLHKVAETSTSAKSGSAESAKTEETFVNSAFDSTQTQTQKTDGSSSTPKVTYAEMVDTNIFASSSESGTTLNAESIFSEYESKLNDMLNKTMKQTSRAMTFSTIAAGLSSAGDLLTSLSGNKTANNIFSSVFGGSSTSTQSAVSPLSTELGLTNDLSTAIASYSNKGSSENWTALVNQIALAKNDKNSLKTYMDEQQQIIKDYPAKEAALKQEIEEAKQDKLEKGKAVEAVKDGIQAATRKNTIEKTEIPAQEKVISESNGRITAAKTKYEGVQQAQNSIKTQYQAILDKPRTSSTDASGNVTYSPSDQEISNAKAKIKEADDKIKQAKEEYDNVCKKEIGHEAGVKGLPSENSVQGVAIAKVNALKKEIEEKDKIIAESGSTQEELESIQKAYLDSIDKINAKNDELQKLKDNQKQAQLRYNQANSQDKALDKQIAEAEKLMSAKK